MQPKLIILAIAIALSLANVLAENKTEDNAVEIQETLNLYQKRLQEYRYQTQQNLVYLREEIKSLEQRLSNQASVLETEGLSSNAKEILKQ